MLSSSVTSGGQSRQGTGAGSREVKVSNAKKIMLNGLLGACEASFTFEQLYMSSVLQQLGMSPSLVPLYTVVNGLVATLLIPVMGRLSDSGPNPHCRKMGLTLLCAVLLATGQLLVPLASHFHSLLHPAPPSTNWTVSDPVDSSLISNLPSTSTSRLTTDSSAAQRPALVQSTDAFPLWAWVASLGFACMECAFDFGTCFSRSWMLACTPFSEHASLLTVGVVLSAVGAALPAALHLLDLDDLLQGLTVPGHIFIQSQVILVMILVGTIMMVVTGNRLHRLKIRDSQNVNHLNTQHTSNHGADTTTTENHTLGVASDLEADKSDGCVTAGLVQNGDIVSNGNIHFDTKIPSFLPFQLISSDEDCSGEHDGNSGDPDRGENPVSEQTLLLSGTDSGSKQPVWVKMHCGAEYGSRSVSTEPSIEKRKTIPNHQTSTNRPLNQCLEYVRGWMSWSLSSSCPQRGFKWKVTTICLGTYISSGAILFFDFLAVDYIGKVIYKGDPTACKGSPSAVRYDEGMKMMAWALLVYNGAFLVYSLLQHPVLKCCGYKMEFVMTQLLLGLSFALLAVTSRIEVLFFMASAAGMRRVSLCVVPFKLMNDAVHEQALRSGGKERVGLAMSLVGGTIPFAACSLYPWVGMLQESTASMDIVMWLGAAYSAVASLCFLAVPEVSSDIKESTH